MESVTARRFQFLHKLYEKSNGNPSKYVYSNIIGEELGLDEQNTMDTMEYLEGKGLLRILGRSSGDILVHKPRNISFHLLSITPKGVDEIEAAMSGKKTPTEGIPPNITYIIVGGSVSHSQISQNSPGSTQTYNTNKMNLDQVKEIIDMLDPIYKKYGLTPDQESEVNSEIQRLRVETSTPKPRYERIKESLQSISNILTSVAAAGNIIMKIGSLLG
jgi:hypothetical protein